MASFVHEGLRYSLMKTPRVSGANTYQGLCGAAKSDEGPQCELIKRQPYQREDSVKNSANTKKNLQAVESQQLYPTNSNPGGQEKGLNWT